jgi:hypothetical protein
MSILRGENKKNASYLDFFMSFGRPKGQRTNPVEIMKGRIAGFLDFVPFTSRPALRSE